MVPVIATICVSPVNVPRQTHYETFLVIWPILGKLPRDLPQLPSNSYQIFDLSVDVVVDGRFAGREGGLDLPSF